MNELYRAVWALAEGLALIALAITVNKDGKDAMVLWTSASDLYQDARKERLRGPTDAPRGT